MQVHREKPKNHTLENTSSKKSTEITKYTVEAIEVEWARSSREVGLLWTREENLDHLDPALLGLKARRDTEGSAVSKKERPR